MKFFHEKTFAKATGFLYVIFIDMKLNTFIKIVSSFSLAIIAVALVYIVWFLHMRESVVKKQSVDQCLDNVRSANIIALHPLMEELKIQTDEELKKQTIQGIKDLNSKLVEDEAYCRKNY